MLKELNCLFRESLCAFFYVSCLCFRFVADLSAVQSKLEDVSKPAKVSYEIHALQAIDFDTLVDADADNVGGEDGYAGGE